MNKKSDIIVLSPTLYPNLLRWLSSEDETSGIDVSCLADEIHEFVQNLSSDKLDAIVGKLLTMYRDQEFKQFVHQFIPLFVNMHMNSGRSDHIETLEIFFLGVYNTSLTNEACYVQVPTALQKSPPSGKVNPTFLRTLHMGGRRFLPKSCLTSISDVQTVFLRLIILFNESISGACWHAQHQFCILARHVADKEKDESGNLRTSILFTIPAVIEIVSCLHYLCRNEQSESAHSVLQAIHDRGCKDVIPELMLITRSTLLLLQDFRRKSDQMNDVANRASVRQSEFSESSKPSCEHNDEIFSNLDSGTTQESVAEPSKSSSMVNLSSHEVLPEKKTKLGLFSFSRKKRTSQASDDGSRQTNRNSQFTL